MEVILAQIFGLFLLIVGLGMILNTQLFIDAFEDLKHSPGVRVISALFPVFLGAVIVPFHPIFIMNWTLSLTILGYGLLVLGTLRYWFMRQYVSMVSSVMGKTWIRVTGLILFLWGGFMVFHAFPVILDLLIKAGL